MSPSFISLFEFMMLLFAPKEIISRFCLFWRYLVCTSVLSTDTMAPPPSSHHYSLLSYSIFTGQADRLLLSHELVTHGNVNLTCFPLQQCGIFNLWKLNFQAVPHVFNPEGGSMKFISRCSVKETSKLQFDQNSEAKLNWCRQLQSILGGHPHPQSSMGLLFPSRDKGEADKHRGIKIRRSMWGRARYGIWQASAWAWREMGMTLALGIWQRQLGRVEDHRTD